jgi:hypothetical protein
MRRLLLVACLVGAAAGCNNDCYNLAQTICQCQPSSTAISTCKNNVSVQNSNAHPSADDLARCHAQLQICDCRALQNNSVQGKINCGLARENPADQTMDQ